MARNATFIGFGEAASAIVAGWGGGDIRAFDVKTDDPRTAPAQAARCAELGVIASANPAEALAGADLVFSTVTADQAIAAAEAAAPHLAPGALWCDLNSCSPKAKRRAAALIEAAGGRYVDVAVMAPVHPGLNMTPLLLSGPHAEAAARRLAALPMAPRAVGAEVGAASSIKMIRSVMVKGLEALTTECILAAVAAGVEDEVLGSLARSHPGRDWARDAAYNLERMIVHGERRAAEMDEVAATLADLGLAADMARATARWQRRVASAGATAPDDPVSLGARALALPLLDLLASPG